MVKILLAEDNQFFQKLYASKLTQEGFEVVVASDGEEALAKVEEANPNLIILDMIMPKKDGFEVLEALGANEKLKKIPVIVFSSLEQKEDIEKAKKLGACEYINKSGLNFDSLRDKIISLIDKTN